MQFLFLIPARRGSKGIPKKNIKPLAGKPLILYSVETARQITDDSNICVSTDDPEIIEIVEKAGLKVPFIRPKELATDSTPTYDVILHALNFFEKNNKFYDAIVLLQPTSPFRRKEHIQNSISIYTPKLDLVVSVTETKSNPYYILYEEDTNGFLFKSKNGNFTRRQDCPKVYELNGSIYIFNTKSLKEKSILEFKKIKKFLMDRIYSIDLDDELDWKFAEFLLQNNAIDL